MDIRATSDDGRPIVASSPDGIHAQDLPRHRRQGLGGAAGSQGRAHRATQARDRGGRHRTIGCLRGRQTLPAVGRDAARHEPVRRGAGPFAGPARHRRSQAQGQDQGAAPGRQLCDAYCLRRRPRHRAVRLVVPADPRPRARAALGRVSGLPGPEGAGRGWSLARHPVAAETSGPRSARPGSTGKERGFENPATAFFLAFAFVFALALGIWA